MTEIVEELRESDAAEKPIWLVYSRQHNAFWRPKAAGYTFHIEIAGRYTRDDAEKHCDTRTESPDGGPSEVAVLAPEAADRIVELEAAILKAHPSGDDESPDPLKVVETLGREWQEMLMQGPPQTVTFVDEDGNEGKIAFEVGDETVGIQDGYVLDEYPALTAARGQINVLREALRLLIQYSEWQIAEGFAHHPTLPSAVSKAKTDLSATTPNTAADLIRDAVRAHRGQS